MSAKVSNFQETPSQTAGPYVHIGLMPTHAGNAGSYDGEIGVSPFVDGVKGEIIEISGAVIDGQGMTLRDAVIESWQADADGRYPGETGADPCITGHCRFAADSTSGEFCLRTVKPGIVADRAGVTQAPHISLWIVARGINQGLSTRIYFEDEDNESDFLLGRIENKNRCETLIAKKTGEASYRFDIRLQGPDETVFLDI
jgi:protocatechuate 3,4-dioxygenase alpha subunit